VAGSVDLVEYLRLLGAVDLGRCYAVRGELVTIAVTIASLPNPSSSPLKTTYELLHRCPESSVLLGDPNLAINCFAQFLQRSFGALLILRDLLFAQYHTVRIGGLER
jgi:hypothetical protein